MVSKSIICLVILDNIQLLPVENGSYINGGCLSESAIIAPFSNSKPEASEINRTRLN